MRVSINENTEIILEYLSYRGLALPADISRVLGRGLSQTHRILRQMSEYGWVEKLDDQSISRHKFLPEFYRITQAGYIEVNSDFGDEQFFAHGFPTNLTHKVSIDYVTALLFQYGYRPYGKSRSEIQAKLKVKGRVPDALMSVYGVG